MKHSNPPHRIEESGFGLGEISREQIEDRAAEIAEMEGRDAVNESDLARAREELQGPVGLPPAPELVDSSLEDVVAWDEAADASGRRAPRVGLDDEASVAEQLVEEGIEEAEHDRRNAAADDKPTDI